jgi:hypothetical protein
MPQDAGPDPGLDGGITIQHRLVSEVLADERIVKVLRMWTHCE